MRLLRWVLIQCDWSHDKREDKALWKQAETPETTEANTEEERAATGKECRELTGTVAAGPGRILPCRVCWKHGCRYLDFRLRASRIMRFPVFQDSVYGIVTPALWICYKRELQSVVLTSSSSNAVIPLLSRWFVMSNNSFKPFTKAHTLLSNAMVVFLLQKKKCWTNSKSTNLQS